MVKPMNPQSVIFREPTTYEIATHDRARANPPPAHRTNSVDLSSGQKLDGALLLSKAKFRA